MAEIVMSDREYGTYIKLYRRIANWGWYQEPNTFKTFIHCLICASTKPKEYKGMTLDTGEFVMGYEKFGKECGLSRQQLRTAISHLRSTNELTIKSTNKGTIVRVVNFGFYQGCDCPANQRINQQVNQQPTNDFCEQIVNTQNFHTKSTNESTNENSFVEQANKAFCEYEFSPTNQQSNQQPTNNQPTTNQRPTTNNKDNKDNNTNNTNKKENILKEKIPPTYEEVEKYCQERNNKIDAQQFIDFYEARGWLIGKAKMKDWKAAVRTWENRRKENGKEEKKVDRGFIPAGTVFD